MQSAITPASQEPFRLQQVGSRDIQSPLLSHRHNIASQDGEDGVIERIFQVIRPQNKFAVEFGAWDGKLFSNVWNLIKNHQWSGALIEGNEDKYRSLVAEYSGNADIKCLNCFVDFDGANSLDNLLTEVGSPINLDFLSIDVDGTDYFIWESLSRYQPRALVV